MLKHLFAAVTGITPDDPYIKLYQGLTESEAKILRSQLENDESICTARKTVDLGDSSDRIRYGSTPDSCS